MTGPAVAAALRATSLEVLRNAGRYDAVVIGAGAAGGMAALSLVEGGLRVVVLDAGIVLSPLRKFSLRLSRGIRSILGHAAFRYSGSRRQKIQCQCYAWPLAPDSFVDDIECPYVTPGDHPFVWIRARQLGGRWAIPDHGRQCYRLSPYELNPQDGLSAPWPLTAGELDPWYAKVERRIGIAGRPDHLPWLPDSDLSVVLEPTAAEAALQKAVTARWRGARPVLQRSALPFDALEVAAKTGRLLIRSGAIVREIEVERSGRVRGVVWIDQRNGTQEHARAPLVFLCASALESTRLLLLSRSRPRRDELGASSGPLGRYLMDHVLVRASGRGPPLREAHNPDKRHRLYLPRFDARDSAAPGSRRGFGVQIIQLSETNRSSRFLAASFGEMLPRPENRVTL